MVNHPMRPSSVQGRAVGWACGWGGGKTIVGCDLWEATPSAPAQTHGGLLPTPQPPRSPQHILYIHIEYMCFMNHRDCNLWWPPPALCGKPTVGGHCLPAVSPDWPRHIFTYRSIYIYIYMYSRICKCICI